MLLSLTTTHTPATDLGYLLHKHPDRCQQFPLAFGQAHVFYPEATVNRCTAALLLDINPIELVRGKFSGGKLKTLAHYINDDQPLPLTAELAVLPLKPGRLTKVSSFICNPSCGTTAPSRPSI